MRCLILNQDSRWYKYRCVNIFLCLNNKKKIFKINISEQGQCQSLYNFNTYDGIADKYNNLYIL